MTPKAQRIGILVIAVVMVIGTLGSFAMMILANENSQNDQVEQAKAAEEFQKQQDEAQEEYRKKLRPLDGYEAAAFDASKVTELTVEILKQGEGEELKADSALSVNYFGWTADGKIFDSTNLDGTTTPNESITLDGVIEGWTKGLAGQRAGSTVKLTIPTDQAYGENAEAMGRPAGPLQFIIEIVAVK